MIKRQQYFRIGKYAEHIHKGFLTVPDLLTDVDFIALDNVTKAQLLSIWMLLSSKNNDFEKLPYDSITVKKLISSNRKVNLRKLLDRGFISLIK